MNLPEMIKQLYSVTEDQLKGYDQSEISFVKKLFGALPGVLEDFWSSLADTDALHGVQDHWIRPEDFHSRKWLIDSDHLILLNENQGSCCAGIRREDLKEADPPVYASMDDKNWTLCAHTTSEFLQSVLCYEAVFAFSYQADDFVLWLTEKELQVIQSNLEKKPFELHGWIGMELSFYSNAYDHMVVVMDCGDLEVIYGAASEKAYKKLLTIMEGFA